MSNHDGDFASDLLSAEYLPYYGGHLQQRVRVIPTPFPAFNSVCLGAGDGKGPAEGWFGIIGGNPGSGKTVVGLNHAATAIEAGYDTVLASMEMLRHDLAPRVYSRLLGDTESYVGRGARFSENKFTGLQDQLAAVREKFGARLLVNKRPLKNKKELFAFLRGCFEQYGARYMIIDYIQLACTGGEESIYSETVEVVNGLARFAHEEGIRIEGLSQFKRSTAEDFTRPPTAQGLHGGMIVEASADYILLIDHSRWQRDTMRKYIARTWLMADKVRYGPDIKGMGAHDGIPVEFDFRSMSIREVTRAEAESIWPTRKK